LRVDSEVALTFASIALRSKDQETTARTTRVARKAYDTIVKFRRGIALSAADKSKLDGNLRRLRKELQSLGEGV
jgi:hypothetical protein